MSAADSIDRLRSIAARLLEREDVAAAWFGAALQEYTAGAQHGLTLDQALGLRAGPGARPWWQLEALARRDEVLRAIAARHFPARSAKAAAEAITSAAQRYEAVGWRRHRAFMAPPAEIAGTLRGELFYLLKTGGALSVRTVERALRHEMPDSVAHAGASNTLDTGETHDGNTGENDDETTSGPGNGRPAAA